MIPVEKQPKRVKALSKFLFIDHSFFAFYFAISFPRYYLSGGAGGTVVNPPLEDLIIFYHTYKGLRGALLQLQLAKQSTRLCVRACHCRASKMFSIIFRTAFFVLGTLSAFKYSLSLAATISGRGLSVSFG